MLAEMMSDSNPNVKDCYQASFSLKLFAQFKRNAYLCIIKQTISLTIKK